jgi:hypothetical protein
MGEIIVPILIEILCGAAGGVAIGAWAPGLNLGAGGNALAGAIGGLILTWVAARIPYVGRFVGHVEYAADAVTQSAGGVTPIVLVGVGIAGLLGGILLTMLVGLARIGGAARKN